MAGINKATLVGRIGADPEIRSTRTGIHVASFSVATSRGKGDDERTEWHRITAWDKLADIVDRYVTKGRLVYIEGRLQTRKWQDKEGRDRWTTEIVARDLQLLDKKPGTVQDAEPYQPPTTPTTAPAGPVAAEDDDLPF